MKHNKTISLILCAGAILSCTQELSPDEGEAAGGQPFTVTLDSGAFAPDTKTVNDGMMTKWGDADQISLYFSETGKEISFVRNQAFTIADTRTGRFEGSLAEELIPDKNYDWYAIYPYNTNHSVLGTYGFYTYKTGIELVQTQTGNDSKAHLAGTDCILIGKVENVPSSEYPTIRMKPAASVVDFNVKNSTGSDIEVKEIKVWSSNGMVPSKAVMGFDFTKPLFDAVMNPYLPDGQELWKYFNLNIKDGAAYGSGSSAHFYATTLPVTLNPADQIKVRVITSAGSQTFVKTLEESLVLESGAIKTFNLEYTDAVTKAIAAERPDIETLNNLTSVSGRNRAETFDGWIIDSGCIEIGYESGRVPVGVTGVTLSGDTSAVPENGSLKSPLIAGGCGTLAFKYFHPFYDIDFSVTFKDKDGNVVKTFNITGDGMANGSVDDVPSAEYSQEVSLPGEFYMEIRQNASNPESTKDYQAPKLLLFDIAWTPFAG